MAYLRCEKCNQDFPKPFGSTRCPDCGTKSESEPWEKLPPVVEVNLLDEAKGQAKVVSRFGEALQLVGYILNGVCVIGVIFSLLSRNTIGCLVSAIALLTTFISFNILGSLLRAIGLYIRVKIEK